MVSQTDEIRKTGDIGGQPKMTYWTPDGRIIRAMPDMHEYSKSDKQGKIIENGLRDANLDRGWLATKPEALKPYCEGCDKWHDTQKEVDACTKQKKVFIKQWEKKAKKDIQPDDIGQRMDKLESMFSQILEKLGDK